MKDKIDIRLRLIQQNSNKDKENHFALQRSVEILKNWGRSEDQERNEWSWQESFKNKNRIWYVIEKMPGNVYCGECAVKNISDDLPEIEIELMKEYQGQGIGYMAVTDMLNKLASDYGKENYYAKIEPDNHASRLLFEKLCGQPAGVLRDNTIPDERVNQFTERNRYLLDRNLEDVARKFGVEANVLLTHFLVYKVNVNDIRKNCDGIKKSTIHGEKMDFSRRLTREKHKEEFREFLETLQKIKEAGTNREQDIVINEAEREWTERLDKWNESISFNKEK